MAQQFFTRSNRLDQPIAHKDRAIRDDPEAPEIAAALRAAGKGKELRSGVEKHNRFDDGGCNDYSESGERPVKLAVNCLFHRNLVSRRGTLTGK